ncbi:unnamed protein product, partial [Discosporangium mesarthrocarpum]
MTSASEERWVYHEKQESSLCGQHCLNNLLQDGVFSAPDLAEIAQELDAKERQYMLEAGITTPDALRFLAEDSGNVDEAGNFSIQVLNEALRRYRGLYLVSADSADIRGNLSTNGYSREDSFVCNKQAHWFSIRVVGGTYWNLNSTLSFPEPITMFRLEATLHQYLSDGYSVFVVRGGKLTPTGQEPGRGGARENWYRVEELLAVARSGSRVAGSTKPGTAATDVWLNSGPGQRLDGGGGGGGARGGGDMAYEEELALALSMSAESQQACREAGLEEGPGVGDLGPLTGEDNEISRAIALSL